MPRLLITTLALAALAFGQCPLGYTPDQACEASNPTCGLFKDENGDGLCDNPGPQVVETPPDTIPEVVETPDTIVAVQPVDSDTLQTPVGPDNPTEPAAGDTTAVIAPADTAPVDSTLADSTGQQVSLCPLGLSVAEACSSLSPRCALYSDTDGDGRCNNPGPQPELADSVATDSEAASRTRLIANGCPLYLPPAAACPYSRQLCPHWMGWSTASTCLNPRGGLDRALLYLVVTAALLAVGTVLSRTIRGRRNRRKAKRARTIVLAFSAIVLGFVLQGCYCPIGMWQYLFAGMLGFIPVFGLILLLLPILHALLFGRVYCGWVCPLGAMQELLGRVPVPGVPRIPRGLDRVLVIGKYILATLFTAAVFASARGFLDVGWPALFCIIDPFHSAYSLFLTGSVAIAVIAISLSILFGRFFCRYFCFYGAVLSLACRAGLWTRLCRLGGRKAAACEQTEESSPSCEIQR